MRAPDAEMVKQGDFSMLVVWAGLEARRFMQASIDDVSYLLLSVIVSKFIQLSVY
jgi:hypothetical protein